MSIFKKAVSASFFLTSFLQFLMFSMPKIETLKKYIIEKSEHFRQQNENTNFDNWAPITVFKKNVHERDNERLDCFWIGFFHPLYPHFMPVSQKVVKVNFKIFWIISVWNLYFQSKLNDKIWVIPYSAVRIYKKYYKILFFLVFLLK